MKRPGLLTASPGRVVAFAEDAVRVLRGPTKAGEAGGRSVVRPIPEGLLEPSVLQPNVRSVAELARIVADALEEAGYGGEPIAALLPDLSLRAFAVEPGTPPPAVRAELERRLPFPVAEARTDEWGGPRTGRLVAAIRRGILEQFETVLEAVARRPGWVDGTSLATLPDWLRSVESDADGLCVYVQLYRRTYSVAAVGGRRWLEYRLRLRAEDDAASIAEELARLPKRYEARRVRLRLGGEDAAACAARLEGEGLVVELGAEGEAAQVELAMAALARRRT